VHDGLKLNRRQRLIAKRRLKDIAGGVGAFITIFAFTTWMMYAWLSEPMTDWSGYIEDNHIGMIEVGSGAWLTADEYSQYLREKEAWSEKEEATHDVVTQSEQPKEEKKRFDVSAGESEMLARIAMAEAGTEDIQGKALVMLVVLNRVESNLFPDTIEQVIKSSGQFSAYENGWFYSLEPTDECYEALIMILNGWDESMGALYFERTSSQPTWHSSNLKQLFIYGNHTFYTQGD
jgi:hypothetical protein